MGQLNGGNKVTKNGFFYGGAGYLMGRGLVDILNSHHLSGPGQEDHIRHSKHLDHLGVFEEANIAALSSCPDCIQFEGDLSDNIHGHGISAILQIRLVDLCTNMFSEESTCYHSDHAISRCLVHGAYADVWNIRCEGIKVIDDPPFTTGMCMGVEECRDDLLSCHRWWPMTTPDLAPMPYMTSESSKKLV